jgi:signal transduction histidine kinase
VSAVGGFLIGVPVLVLLTWTAVRRLLRRQRCGAHLAVAAVVTSSLLGSLPGVSDDRGWPSWAVGLAFASWLGLLAVYPDGRVQPRWGLVPHGLLVTAIAGQAASGGNFQAGPWPALLTGGLLLGIAGQVWRYVRRSDIAERDAVRWLLVGAVPALTFLLGLSLVVATTAITDDVYALPQVRWASEIALWLVPVAAAVGLLAPRRPTADRAVYVAVAVCLVALVLVETYLLLVPAVGADWAAAVVVGLQVPVLFAARLVASVLVYGRDARPALARLGARLEGAIGPDDVPGTVADAVRGALYAPYAAVALSPDGIAESGSRPADARIERFPVVYDARRVAEILVAVRAGERALSSRDQDVVDRLAARAGGALHGAAVMAELRAAREDLVLAREEERRRLRRDLHDDLAPTLAGLGMRAAAVAALARTDLAQAASVAEGLEAGLQGAAEQVRHIAYDLRPPLLDDQGLASAVRDRVQHVAGSNGLRVHVDAEDTGPLPAAVELAALRIVSESVSNVRRHAHAQRCTVSLRKQHHHLRVEVRDDGRGFDLRAPSGIGLTSISERAAELGGHCDIASSTNGTTVRVWLPVSEDA